MKMFNKKQFTKEEEKIRKEVKESLEEIARVQQENPKDLKVNKELIRKTLLNFQKLKLHKCMKTKDKINYNKIRILARMMGVRL